MPDLRIGSLCTGTGALDIAASNVFGGDLIWTADNDQAATKLIASRFPGIPNLGDLTTVDWTRVRKPDILTCGFPCQPVSSAGQRLGTDDERWIWPYVANTVRVLRPGVVILENVAAILGRGIGDVLGSLAALGYMGSYRCVTAGSCGAPHKRDRWFAVACPESSGRGSGFPGLGLVADAGRPGRFRVARRQCADGVFATGNLAASAGVRWGRYEPAIRRWETILGRLSPDPVIQGRTRNRLNPVFAEWMMGYPEGWVTGVPGLSYQDQLHLIGNGVVVAQAEFALRSLPDVQSMRVMQNFP